MSELEELQKKVRKLNSKAGNAKMELHDLAEDLPISWTDIKVVAERTYAVFAELEAAKADLAAMEGA
ncbi:CCE_0567 family metalloprotein [Rhizobium daejeonense]